MKYIKEYKVFESKSEIDLICKKYKIKNYIINEDNSIDVDGHVDLAGFKLNKLPLKFRNVSGFFDCAYNELTSLEGAPRSVGGGFYCSSNNLTSFEGLSDYITIKGGFLCRYNPVYNIWELFEDYKKIELLNFYNCLVEEDGKPAVILYRLNDFLEEIGKPTVDKIEGYINI